jgi:hypothetical protein
MRASLACVLAAAVACSKGAQTPVSDTCGTGTHDEGGVCVLTLRCGAGTHQSGSDCLGDADAGSACAAGTHLAVDGTCQPNVICGTGTHQDAGACVADAICGAGPDGGCISGGASCGPGTHANGTDCEPDVVCGAGTVPLDGSCVPATAPGEEYDVRVGVQSVNADGFSTVPVLAIGRNADGSPSTAPVVLSLTNPGAGRLDSTAFPLLPTGRALFFTPCDSNQPACTGTFQITMAKASAPATPIASSWTLTLHPPVGLGDPSPCLGGGNVLFLNGEAGDFIHPGMETINTGTFTVNRSTFDVSVSVDTAGFWSLHFSTDEINVPLDTQVYQNTERWPFEDPGHPGLDVSGDGSGCNISTGAFQVEDLQVTPGGSLTSFTATFEQHCEAAAPALRGCIHVGN